MSTTDETADMDYIERVEHYRDDVADDLEEEYDQLLAEGRSPRVAAAVCCYVEELFDEGEGDRVTQEGVADQYGINAHTISTHYTEVFERQWRVRYD